jgi:hypothetical protein
MAFFLKHFETSYWMIVLLVLNLGVVSSWNYGEDQGSLLYH